MRYLAIAGILQFFTIKSLIGKSRELFHSCIRAVDIQKTTKSSYSKSPTKYFTKDSIADADQ